MTNWEKYKDEILKFSSAGGFAKIGDELAYCIKVDCNDCWFKGNGGCTRAKAEWLDEEYKEPSPYADWQIDDKIEVRDLETQEWKKRHFAGVNEDGLPTTWCAGTSWTSYGDWDKVSWEYARKVEE